MPDEDEFLDAFDQAKLEEAWETIAELTAKENQARQEWWVSLSSEEREEHWRQYEQDEQRRGSLVEAAVRRVERHYEEHPEDVPWNRPLDKSGPPPS